MSKFRRYLLQKLLNKYRSYLENELKKPMERRKFIPSADAENSYAVRKESLRSSIECIDDVIANIWIM